MDFEQFKNLHSKYSGSGWSELDMSDFSEYTKAIQENEEFHHWAIKTNLDEAGFDHSSFCCITMANHIYLSYDENGDIEIENHDIVMNKWKDGTFGIPIHDGGSSVVKINFCPWCGSNLKANE